MIALQNLAPTTADLEGKMEGVLGDSVFPAIAACCVLPICLMAQLDYLSEARTCKKRSAQFDRTG